jgi:serine/threonine protein kinase
MSSLTRQIVEGYKSLKVVAQETGSVLFSGQEPDSKRDVWIRVLTQVLEEDPKIAARFRGLSRTIRQLNHPNIASISKVGEESGLPYIVTRAIEKAQPLAARLDQPWAVEAAADVAMQVGQALDHAYKRGLVHGNLSPENIVVQDDGRVMVTDFGLAELQELVGSQVSQAATPFQAPERVAGQPADARADVYSLATILYSMLTKRTPQIVEGQVLPPSHFNSDVSSEMDRVVVKALSANPEDRYPDARSFLAAFGAVKLAPVVKPRAAKPLVRCPQCGARKQSGRFCRKCGSRLTQPKPVSAPPPSGSILDEPIQVTQVEVGRVSVGKGIEVRDTVIARPTMVATGDLADMFPEPLPMPKVDLAGLCLEVDCQEGLSMPELAPMPVIDWAEVAPPMPEVPTLEQMTGGSNGDE